MAVKPAEVASLNGLLVSFLSKEDFLSWPAERNEDVKEEYLIALADRLSQKGNMVVIVTISGYRIHGKSLGFKCDRDGDGEANGYDVLCFEEDGTETVYLIPEWIVDGIEIYRIGQPEPLQIRTGSPGEIENTDQYYKEETANEF